MAKGRIFSLADMSNPMGANGEGDGGMAQERTERSLVPTRRDTCRLFLSGVLGNEPKETYLAVGNNYVLNFPLAVTGHFNAIHDWEKYKPAETMWMSCEVWNDEARAHQSNLYKGASISGVATLIFNKWTDKTTGEERKMTKVRFTNIMSAEEMAEMLGSSGIEDLSPSYGDDPSGSSFASEAPDSFDQTPPPSTPMRRPAEATNPAPVPRRPGTQTPRGELDWNDRPASNSRKGPTIPF